jgi:histidinol-phosphate aminotransferase
MTDLPLLLRKNIRSLIPYSSARDEYKGEEAIFMDANENPYNHPYNRYPDPLQVRLKDRIAALKGVAVQNIFLGNGSDEAIDLLIRAFCEPGQDNILAIKPSYGMYKVCADINGVEYREALLNQKFQVEPESLLALSDSHSKLLFLCSPNNPTSNSLRAEDILNLVNKFSGLVVLDEAYIDFSAAPSFICELDHHPNLVILQTFSKAWGMAGIRLGMAFAGRNIIDILNRIKYPYNVNILTQRTALEHLVNTDAKDKWVCRILEQRNILQLELSRFSMVKNILHSDANFLMVRFDDPKAVFDFLIGKKIIVRDRSRVPLCEGYLRITIGTAEENLLLVSALIEFTASGNIGYRNPQPT